MNNWQYWWKSNINHSYVVLVWNCCLTTSKSNRSKWILIKRETSFINWKISERPAPWLHKNSITSSTINNTTTRLSRCTNGDWTALLSREDNFNLKHAICIKLSFHYALIRPLQMHWKSLNLWNVQEYVQRMTFELKNKVSPK